MSAESSLKVIEEIGIVPSIRLSSVDDARFAIDTVYAAGVPIVEVTMTIPNALDIIRSLANSRRGVLVGAGTVLDATTATQCIDAGAEFITSPGFSRDVVETTRKRGILALPGAVTPTDVMAAREAGVAMVKVFPCAEFGGPALIRALRAPFPDAKFVAAGGVNQLTVADFIRAGAIAVGVGGELIPRRAVEQHDRAWIAELVHRFRHAVYEARAETAGHSDDAFDAGQRRT